MEVNPVRKQLATLARARWETALESAPAPTWKEAAERKAKAMQKFIRGHRQSGAGRPRPNGARSRWIQGGFCRPGEREIVLADA